MTDSIASLDKIQDYRFGSLIKGEHYAFARGLTVNPTHLPDALDAMRKDGWHMAAVFGKTDASEIGFLFERRSDDRIAMSLALTAALEDRDRIARHNQDLLNANTGLVEARRQLAAENRRLDEQLFRFQEDAS